MIITLTFWILNGGRREGGGERERGEGKGEGGGGRERGEGRGVESD